MAATTALELINKVRLLRRQPTVTGISTDEDTATLNALNMAIEDILGVRRYEFDKRHDGQIVLKAPLTITSVDWPTVGGTTATLTHSSSFETTDLGGDFVTRILPTGDDEYANTPFRVDSYTANPTTTATVTMAVGAPVAETITGCKLVYTEYMLPDTVREVLNVTYQEEEINLQAMAPNARFEEWIPNTATEDGEPEVVAIGGFDEGTYDDATDVAPKLRMAVWPLPDDEYVLNYSYFYRHPELTVATSRLEGVPQEVVSDIVMQATAIMGMSWDGNFAMAHFSDMAQAQAEMKKRALNGSSSGRRKFGAWSSGSSTRLAVEDGFPNKVIGS